MNGKGIDRHLFSLYVVSKGQGHVRTISFFSIVFPFPTSHFLFFLHFIFYLLSVLSHFLFFLTSFSFWVAFLFDLLFFTCFSFWLAFLFDLLFFLSCFSFTLLFLSHFPFLSHLFCFSLVLFSFSLFISYFFTSFFVIPAKLALDRVKYISVTRGCSRVIQT